MITSIDLFNNHFISGIVVKHAKQVRVSTVKRQNRSIAYAKKH
jgi:hypothetical protein